MKLLLRFSKLPISVETELMNFILSGGFAFGVNLRSEVVFERVKLISTGIAQFRAEDMIKRDYFGHYDLKDTLRSTITPRKEGFMQWKKIVANIELL